jgi:hypothetical protein
MLELWPGESFHPWKTEAAVVYPAAMFSPFHVLKQ